MIIVGITGTLGAGKGTIVKYLVNNKGFRHYSVRQFLVEEIEKRGLPVNRDTMTEVANDLRVHHNPAYIIEQLYKKATDNGGNAIIESIRTPGEVGFLRKQGRFILIAVDADSKIRYNRIIKRASSTDNVDFSTFISNERREFISTDPNKQNLGKCIKLSDIIIKNNGTMEELDIKLDAELKETL